jgi:hypothetical protein
MTTQSLDTVQINTITIPQTQTPDNVSLSSSTELWNSCKTWLKRTLAISSFMGLLIVITYFLRIRHLPIDSFSSMASLGGIVAFLACVLLFSFAALWGTPTVVMVSTQTIAGWGEIAPRFWKHGACIVEVDSPAVISPRRVIAVITLAIAIPWLLVLIAAIPSFVADTAYRFLILLALLFFWTLGLIWFTHEKRPPVGLLGPIQPEVGWHGYCKRGVWFTALSFSCVYPLLAFTQITTLSPLEITGTSDLWLWMFLGIAALIMLHSLNLAFELTKSEKSKVPTLLVQVCATIICFVMVFIALGTTKVHDRLMQAVSVRLPHVHIVVQETTCNALRLAGISAMRYAPLPGDEITKSCILLDVTILSKLGAQWRVACASDSNTVNNYKGFDIDAKDVIALVDMQQSAKNSKSTNNVCIGMWAP